MADMMNFPKRWEDFLHDYEFEDSRRIYTNGSRLIQSFRVKQMMEYYAPVRHGRWLKDTPMGYRCSRTECRCLSVFGSPYCPKCGAKMDGGSDG